MRFLSEARGRLHREQWNLSDKVVVITGASRGIGAAVAGAVAAKGARVGLIARSREDLDAVLSGLGGRGSVAAADVSDRGELARALTGLEAELGPIDVLVANAGIGAYGAFADMEADLMERLVGVNVLGTMHAVRAVVPGMINRRTGHIVILGSIAGRIGAPFEAVYSATKFAQVGLTEALFVELAPYAIAVSMVNPGPVLSGFFDSRGQPYNRARPKQISVQEVASAVVGAVENAKLEQYLPERFRAAVRFRHLCPPLFGWGVRRSFRAELAADEAKRS